MGEMRWEMGDGEVRWGGGWQVMARVLFSDSATQKVSKKLSTFRGFFPVSCCQFSGVDTPYADVGVPSK